MLQKKLLAISVLFPFGVGERKRNITVHFFSHSAALRDLMEWGNLSRSFRGMFAPVSTIHFACLRHKTWDATRISVSGKPSVCF